MRILIYKNINIKSLHVFLKFTNFQFSDNTDAYLLQFSRICNFKFFTVGNT